MWSKPCRSQIKAGSEYPMSETITGRIEGEKENTKGFEPSDLFRLPKCSSLFKADLLFHLLHIYPLNKPPRSPEIRSGFLLANQHEPLSLTRLDLHKFNLISRSCMQNNFWHHCRTDKDRLKKDGIPLP